MGVSEIQIQKKIKTPLVIIKFELIVELNLN